MACATAKSAVVIPAVRKGLCNQRVRMVQDVMLAHLFGAAACGQSAPTLGSAAARSLRLLMAHLAALDGSRLPWGRASQWESSHAC